MRKQTIQNLIKFRKVFSDVALVISFFLLIASIIVVSSSSSLISCPDIVAPIDSSKIKNIAQTDIEKYYTQDTIVKFSEKTLKIADNVASVSGYFVTKSNSHVVYTSAYLTAPDAEPVLVYLSANQKVFINKLDSLDSE